MLAYKIDVLETLKEAVLKAVTEATGLREVRWVRGVNTCEIYYLSS